MEWVRDNKGWWHAPRSRIALGGYWSIDVWDNGQFVVAGEKDKYFDRLADAKAWCESQERATQPPEPLPAVWSVWGVPGKPETRRFVHEVRRTEVNLSNKMVWGTWHTLESWHAWVRETGAVDLIADRAALVAELDQAVKRAEAAELIASHAQATAASLRRERDDANEKAVRAGEKQYAAEVVAKEAINRAGKLKADLDGARLATEVSEADLLAKIDVGNKQDREIEQILGRALGYPRYADDQKNFPGATGDDVCVGEHVPVTLAMEAASCLSVAEKQRDELRAEVARIKAPVKGEPEWVESFTRGIDWKFRNSYLSEIAAWVRKLIRERDQHVVELDRIIKIIQGHWTDKAWVISEVESIALRARKGGGNG